MESQFWQLECFFWFFYIQPCVECLFAALFKEFAPIITPILIGMVRENGELCDPADISSVLKKDARMFVYC